MRWDGNITLNHNRLEILALKAQRRIKNKLLEDFQAEYFGKARHWYYRFFYHLVAEMRPAIALEIGVHWGHCMLHMAYGNRASTVVGIDKRAAEYTIHNYTKYNPGNCYLFNMDSTSIDAERVITELTNKYGLIGLVFQDSSHHYEESHKEFNIYSKYLAQGAVWCCDDIMDIFHDPLIDPPGKSMLSYFNELPGDKRLYKKLHHGSVIGITIL